MSKKIQIVGLGPGELDQMTLAAWRAVTQAAVLVFRTERHPCVAEILAQLQPGAIVQSCDDLYEAHAEFAQVYQAIVRRVVALAEEHGTVVYAVPGHPAVGELTTSWLQAAGIDVAVVAGLSFIEPSFAAVGVDPMEGAQIVDAMGVARTYLPRVDVNLPLLLAQVYARWLASDLKLTLLAVYPEQHPVTVVRMAGTAQQRLTTVPLAELDHGDFFDHLTSVYVPPLPPGSSFVALQEVVAHLRAPEGCPWDREQTLASLRSDLFDESAELVEAIEGEVDGSDCSAAICEELGDVLLSATMLAQIASEEGRFRMGEVVRGVVNKLIRRHPHVFGEIKVQGVAHVLANWEAIKAEERAEKGHVAAPLDGVPPALPALRRARKLQAKAAKAGLLDREALAAENPALAALLGAAPQEQQVGELLWQLVALCHRHQIDAEEALRAQLVRFRAGVAGAAE
jgi:tetrapyrrole methylase family protein/MazG family protein